MLHEENCANTRYWLVFWSTPMCFLEDICDQPMHICIPSHVKSTDKAYWMYLNWLISLHELELSKIFWNGLFKKIYIFVQSILHGLHVIWDTRHPVSRFHMYRLGPLLRNTRLHYAQVIYPFFVVLCNAQEESLCTRRCVIHKTKWSVSISLSFSANYSD
jgi:hypothetical protein